MRIEVNRDLCEGNAVCVKVLPQVFAIDESDYVELRVAEPPPELAAKVHEAVKRCPRGALSIVE